MEFSRSRPWRPRWPSFASRVGTRRRGNRADPLAAPTPNHEDEGAGAGIDVVVLVVAPLPALPGDWPLAVDRLLPAQAPGAAPIPPSLAVPSALPRALVASRLLLGQRDDDGAGRQIA